MSDVAHICFNRIRAWFTLVSVIGLGGLLSAQPTANPGTQDLSSSLTVYFPPAPPVLGDPITPRAKGFLNDATVELAAYLNEPFYTPLSFCLAERILGPETRQQLDAYHAAKTSLQTELIAKLYILRDTEAGPRLPTLQDFARLQNQRIHDLDELSEKLRSELSTTASQSEKFKSLKASLPQARGTVPSPASKNIQACLALAFDDNLSPAQRRLVYEIAIESTLTKASPLNPGVSDQPIFFSRRSASQIALRTFAGNCGDARELCLGKKCA